MKGDAVHDRRAIRYGTQGAREPAVAVRRAGDREPISVKKAPTGIVPRPQVADAVHRVVRNLKPIPQCGGVHQKPCAKAHTKTAAVVLYQFLKNPALTGRPRMTRAGILRSGLANESQTTSVTVVVFNFVTCNIDALCYHSVSTHRILLLREALRAAPTAPGVSAHCAPSLPGALLLIITPYASEPTSTLPGFSFCGIGQVPS